MPEWLFNILAFVAAFCVTLGVLGLYDLWCEVRRVDKRIDDYVRSEAAFRPRSRQRRAGYCRRQRDGDRS